MIYTITTNPSIDYILKFDDFVGGATLRAKEDFKFPGGKGIMASKILKNLGANPINLGFVGGFTGAFIKSSIKNLGLEEDFVEIDDDSRINVKLKYGQETEINAKGPRIREAEIGEFFKKLEKVSKDDTIVISGSLPYSLPGDFYLDIIKKTSAKFSIDIAGKNLFDFLPYKPLLVKPNRDELSNIFETDIKDCDIVSFAKKLNELGARNVIVSLGAEGSIFVDGKNAYRAKPVEGRLINSVGSGDSMVGGFVYALEKNYKKLDAYKLAAACGSATAFSPDIGDKKMIKEIFDKIEVEEIGN